MGDPAGIGPEIIVRAWRSAELHQLANGVVLGHPEVLRRAVRLVSGGTDEGPPGPRVVEVHSPEEAEELTRPAARGELGIPPLPCLRVCGDEAAEVPPATIDARGGRAAHDALAAAAELALAGRVQAITTAPLHKEALAAAGIRHPGHTELLAEFCGVREVAMMLYLPPETAPRNRVGLGVVHATLHTALRNVFAELTSEAIQTSIRLAEDVVQHLLDESPWGAPAWLAEPPPPCPTPGTGDPTLHDMPAGGGPENASEARPTPRIGVCALNPHGGEGGLFGDEELRLIRPAVAASCLAGCHAQGPLPADTLLMRAASGEFDAVVAMYHDQGHIALKLLGLHRAVNVTLGLPIIRTSVAHGTAFDLAWTGRASGEGMLQAARVAAALHGIRGTVSSGR